MTSDKPAAVAKVRESNPDYVNVAGHVYFYDNSTEEQRKKNTFEYKIVVKKQTKC